MAPVVLVPRRRKSAVGTSLFLFRNNRSFRLFKRLPATGTARGFQVFTMHEARQIKYAAHANCRRVFAFACQNVRRATKVGDEAQVFRPGIKQHGFTGIAKKTDFTQCVDNLAHVFRSPKGVLRIKDQEITCRVRHELWKKVSICRDASAQVCEPLPGLKYEALTVAQPAPPI